MFGRNRKNPEIEPVVGTIPDTTVQGADLVVTTEQSKTDLYIEIIRCERSMAKRITASIGFLALGLIASPTVVGETARTGEVYWIIAELGVLAGAMLCAVGSSRKASELKNLHSQLKLMQTPPVSDHRRGSQG